MQLNCLGYFGGGGGIKSHEGTTTETIQATYTPEIKAQCPRHVD